MAKTKTKSKIKKPAPAVLPPWLKLQFRGKTRADLILLLAEERNGHVDKMTALKDEHARILAEQQLQMDAVALRVTNLQDVIVLLKADAEFLAQED